MLALPPMQNSYLSQQCGGQYFNYCHTNLSGLKSSKFHEAELLQYTDVKIQLMVKLAAYNYQRHNFTPLS